MPRAPTNDVSNDNNGDNETGNNGIAIEDNNGHGEADNNTNAETKNSTETVTGNDTDDDTDAKTERKRVQWKPQQKKLPNMTLNVPDVRSLAVPSQLKRGREKIGSVARML